MQKHFISAQQLLEDSQELALRVLESGFRPDLVVGVWRGGAPVGVAVHEVLAFAGLACQHCPIRTSSYHGIGEHGRVVVEGLEYLPRKGARKLLIVDDVFDTGRSLYQVVRELERLYPAGMPELRLAVPWFKPRHNETPLTPDYFLHTTSKWLVFPHELQGLSDAEIRRHKPITEKLRERLLACAAKGSRATNPADTHS